MTWLDVPEDHPFPLHTLPYGAFAPEGAAPRLGVRVGDLVLDLAAVAHATGHPRPALWEHPTLNALLAETPEVWAQERAWITDLLTDTSHREAVEPHLHPVESVSLHLPIEIGDYVDFYASEHHAANVGRIFRPDGEPLTPNWKHVPIGYHGRSQTVVVSGTNIVRPCGQVKAPTEAGPRFAASARLDIECELGFVVGGSSALGEPVTLTDAASHLFGVVILNDWSARDIQAWDYVPLGPFLGKSFATSISPWVIPMAALEEARLPRLAQSPEPLPYLREAGGGRGLDISFEVRWNGTRVSSPEYRHMYWTPEQMLAHMTVNGASIRPGDLFGSGTVSGPEPESVGSFLELTVGGREPVNLADGSVRTFLQNGDTIEITATAPGPEGRRLSLGSCLGTVAQEKTGGTV